MLKKPKSKQKTVAEKVAELIARPNQHGSDSDSEDEATTPHVIDFDEDEYQMPEAGTTEFRKRNVKLLSEQSSKYKGKITSRKDFEEDNNSDEEENSDDGDEYEHSDEEENPDEDEHENDYDSDANEEAYKAFSNILEVTQNGTIGDTESDQDDVSGSNEKSDNDSDSEADEEAFEAFNKILEETQSGIIGNVESDSDDEKSDNHSDADVNINDDEDDNSLIDETDSNAENDNDSANDTDNEDDNSPVEDNNDDDDNDETEVISKVNQQAEIQKGTSVQSQLRLWERLLELRINTQKFLSKANQLPACNELKDLVTADAKHKAVLGETCRQTKSLLCRLVSLQNTLYSGFPEINKTMKKCLKRPIPFKENQSGEPALKQMNLYLQDRFETFTPYRNEVLLKWDDRTKLLTPGAVVKKKSMDEDYDIIKKINNVLLNKSMLIQKSQHVKNAQDAKREINDAVNEEEAVLLTCNIYDDSDFYHQQLRELIEYKANTSSNMSEVTKQFLELQKLRQKMKKKVDTRASKGRKMRYVVHNKLINFMAPEDNSTWTDESKEELCKSLFV